MKFEAEAKELTATDVLICGGGPSGISAALAAAREGLSVRLVESRGQLGGTGVSDVKTKLTAVIDGNITLPVKRQ